MCHFATSICECIIYLKPGHFNFIYLIIVQYDKACINSLPDPSHFCESGLLWLVRLYRVDITSYGIPFVYLLSTWCYMTSHLKISPMEILYYCTCIQSNTGDNEGLKMRLCSGGSWANKWILYSQTIKLSFTLRWSCQATDEKTFGTIFSAVTSYSESGRTLNT